MKQTLYFIEKRLLRPMEKISQQRHLAAIRNGVLAAFPLSLIGTIFMLVTILPYPNSWPIHQFIAQHENLILMPYRMTTLLMTLYVVVGVGSHLARYYGYSQVSGSLIALVAFLMTIVPTQPVDMISQAFLNNAHQYGADLSWLKSLEALGWVIPINRLSGVSAYVGVLSALFGVEILHLYNHVARSAKAKNTDGRSYVPEGILDAINSIVPLMLVVSILFFVRHVLAFDFQDILTVALSALIKATNSLPGAMFFVLLMSLISFFGVSGFRLSGTGASLIWLALLNANRAAHLQGEALPNVAPTPFYQFFIWIGGIGATLSLVVLLCFSKSQYLKRLGLTCLLPSLFNLNEPVLYGVPIILNPYMLIPFVCAPVVTTAVSYISVSLNLVGKAFTAPAHMFPGPIGAFFATADWRAVVLSLVNFGIGLLVYYPFLKVYEQKLLAEGEANAKKIALEKEKNVRVTPVEN